jgi:hypothetical protein
VVLIAKLISLIRSTCYPWQFGLRRATRLIVPARKKG